MTTSPRQRHPRTLPPLTSFLGKNFTKHIPVIDHKKGQAVPFHSPLDTKDVKSLINSLRVNKTEDRVHYLTMYTQNIWFDAQDQEGRYLEIINQIVEYLPDFVCLQEFIAPFGKLLFENETIRKTYFVSHNIMNWYTVNILSKWPCYFVNVPYVNHTFMARSLLCAMTVINGVPITVSTTHLESYDNDVDLRIKQMKTSSSILESHPNALIMGDFNYNAEHGKEEAERDTEFVDLYDSAPESTLKFTFIPRRDRLDRMLLKSQCWKPTDKYFLVGTRPIAKYAGKEMFSGHVVRCQSDHLGIMSAVKFEQM